MGVIACSAGIGPEFRASMHITNWDDLVHPCNPSTQWEERGRLLKIPASIGTKCELQVQRDHALKELGRVIAKDTNTFLCCLHMHLNTHVCNAPTQT